MSPSDMIYSLCRMLRPTPREAFDRHFLHVKSITTVGLLLLDGNAGFADVDLVRPGEGT